jgi:hypothetical protein
MKDTAYSGTSRQNRYNRISRRSGVQISVQFLPLPYGTSGSIFWLPIYVWRDLGVFAKEVKSLLRFFVAAPSEYNIICRVVTADRLQF